MTYETRCGALLDYAPCTYGTSRLSFRGPNAELTEWSVAAIGGSSTYGRFVERPYPNRLAGFLQVPVLNLGCQNAGPDAFLADPVLEETCALAAATVVEVTGAINLSNDLYKVHPRRNDRFLSATPALHAVCPGLDLTDVHFTGHLMSRIRARASDSFPVVVRILQQAWTDAMCRLVDRSLGPVILLWFSDMAPPPDCGALPDLSAHHGRPWFVTQEMVEQVARRAAAYVECVVTSVPTQDNTPGLSYSEFEAPIARRILPPRAHQEAAQKLEVVVREFLPRLRQRP